MNGILGVLNTPLTSVQGNSLTLVDLVLTASLVLLFYFLSRLTTRQFQQWLSRRIWVSTTTRRLLTTSLNLTVLIAGVYTSLAYLGVDLSILLVPLGALSIGLGLGLQSLASNYIAGMVLLFERTIRDDDVIEVDSIRGTVVETGLRATVVKTFGNTEVILPNSVLIAQRLDNWTKSDRILRIEAHIGVEYGSDIQTVHSTLLSQIAGHPSVVSDPEPYSYLVEFADSDLLFRILFWINDPAQRWSASSEILEGIYRELGKQSVVIPFPQRDIWFRAEPALGHANGQGGSLL